jgi:hypothetical protein
LLVGSAWLVRMVVTSQQAWRTSLQYHLLLWIDTTSQILFWEPEHEELPDSFWRVWTWAWRTGQYKIEAKVANRLLDLQDLKIIKLLQLKQLAQREHYCTLRQAEWVWTQECCPWAFGLKVKILFQA